MKLVLGIPVIDGHRYTEELVKILIATVEDPKNFTVVIIDNGSVTPYIAPTGTLPFKVDIIRNKENKGYYYPLKQLYDGYDADVLALMHNDVHIYEKGWDIRLKKEVKNNKDIGLFALYGSRKVDKRLYDASPVAYFSQPETHKLFKVKKVTKLTRVLTVDSLFMAFPRKVIPYLGIDEEIALCHFYDKIWPMRLLEHDLYSAVLGIQFMHESNVTSTTQAYFESAAAWWEKRGVKINVGSADFLMRFEGMMRYRIEYKELKQFIPAQLDKEDSIVTV